MKKVVVAVFVCLLLINTSIAYASSSNIKISLDGRQLEFDVAPALIEGRTMVPLRIIFEEMGASVSWNAATSTVTARKDDYELKLTVGSTKAYKNGEMSQLDAPAALITGRTMVPVRWISEALGATVGWDDKTSTVIIRSPLKKPIIRHNALGPAIIGEPLLRAEQMATYVLKHNPEPKLPCSVEELAQIFIEEGQAEGIRGDLAFAQSIHETGFFAFGGQVLPDQLNYAGIGATNGSPVGKGAWFSSIREGVRAQIQHLKAYANDLELNNECVDPRFDLVKRGSAANVYSLAQALNPSGVGWAYPGYDNVKYGSVTEAFDASATYGQRLLAHFNEMLKVEIDN